MAGTKSNLVGGSNGLPWNDKIHGGVLGFAISYGNSVGSVQFWYDDEEGEKHGVESDTTEKHTFAGDETLLSISGYIGGGTVNSLTLTTDKKTYGPYGEATGKKFNYTGDKIYGFYGRSGGDGILSIGAHLDPIASA